MEAVEVKLEDIQSGEEIPIARLKSYAISAFVMRYKVSWNKYVVAVKGCNWSSRTWKVRKICKDSFLFFEVWQKPHCKTTVTGKAANAGDGLRMIVPCQLFFLAEEKFVINLQEKLSKLL